MKKVFTIAEWQKDPGQKVVNSKGEEINVCEKSLGWIMAHTLYIVDEPEPTEFAVQLEQMLYDWEDRGIEARKIVGDWKDKLLSLAREQLVQEGYIIEKKAFHDAVEKVEPDILKEISERVDAKIGSTCYTEKELSKFEKCLKHLMVETIEAGDTHNLHADAEMLLRMARNELLKSGKLLTQEWHEVKLIYVGKKEYENGKAEALKDLPRWKKTDYRPGQKLNHLYYDEKRDMILLDGYYLTTNDVKKLPGFKEE